MNKNKKSIKQIFILLRRITMGFWSIAGLAIYTFVLWYFVTYEFNSNSIGENIILVIRFSTLHLILLLTISFILIKYFNYLQSKFHD